MNHLPVTLFLAIFSICRGVPIDGELSHQPDTFWSSNVAKYPNPKVDYGGCKQSKPSTLCDPNNLLTDSEATNLKDLIQRLENTSPCLCKEGCVEDAQEKGLIVGVALMNSITHSLDNNIYKTSFEMAGNLSKNWNLGSCGNDILILVISERNIGSIHVGDAVKNFLSEATIDEIFEECKGHLQNGYYYQGLESIISSLYNQVQKNILKAPGVNNNDDDGSTGTGNVGLTVGLVVGMACICGFLVAGFLIIRRRKRQNQNGFMYDGANGRPGSKNSGKREIISPIVKQHVVFPDAIYQPCSVEDSRKALKTDNQTVSDEEDEVDNSDEFYLNSLEENPAYESADRVRSQKALSVVDESPERVSFEQPVGVHNGRKITSSRNEDVPLKINLCQYISE